MREALLKGEFYGTVEDAGNPKELFPGEALEQPPHPRGNGTQTKTSLLNSISAFIIKDIAIYYNVYFISGFRHKLQHDFFRDV